MFTMVFPCSTMIFWKVVTVNKHDSTIVLVLALAYIPQTHFHDIKNHASINKNTNNSSSWRFDPWPSSTHRFCVSVPAVNKRCDHTHVFILYLYCGPAAAAAACVNP